MEVHHHSHTERKKWTHYFWEFLMLFLAVFCGFLAENQREHYIEKKREKKYMISLIKDLEQDLFNIDRVSEGKRGGILRNDSLFQLLSAGDLSTQTAHIYYLGRFASLRGYFYPTDGTLQQLRNAGGFRLIQKRDIVDSLQDYENLCRGIATAQELEEVELRDYKEIAARIFDARVFEKMMDEKGAIHTPEGNPRLFGTSSIDINNLLNKLHYAKRSKITTANSLGRLLKKANNLIAMIKKEYHIK